MYFIRFGLLLFLLLRLFVLAPQLRQRFKGDATSTLVDGADVPFKYRVLRRSKTRNVTGTQLALDLPDRFRFRIQCESGFDRFAKAIGIAHEWQTNDRKFDSKAYILSDDAVLLTALSRHEGLRDAIADLLDQPLAVVVRCGYGTLWISTRHMGERDMSDETIAHELAGQTLAQLMRVREELKTVASGMWQAARDPGLRRQNFMLAVTVLLGIAGVIAYVQPMGLEFPRQLMDAGTTMRATWVGGIAIAALFLLASLVMGVRSRLHWVLLELLLVGGPSIWLAAYAESGWENRHYDVAAPQMREVRVNRKYIETGSKNSKHYYFDVSGWPDPRVEQKLEVRSSLFDTFSPPTCAHVEWHAGNLGDSWISNFAPSECGDLEK